MYTEVYKPIDTAPWQPQTQRSVLVVEDDDAIRDTLATVLRDEGFFVHEAANGLEALGLLLNEKIAPSLILLDLVMPHMGGAEFLEALQNEKAWRDFPVALLSAARVEIKSPMMVANLAKPIEIEDLLSVVHRYADQARAEVSGAAYSYS